jgi:hypothetical protein
VRKSTGRTVGWALRALGRASARIGEGAMPTHLVPRLDGICRCASRHDDVIAEPAVAVLQAGNGMIDLFERKPLMLEHREIEQSHSR